MKKFFAEVIEWFLVIAFIALLVIIALFGVGIINKIIWAISGI